MPDESKYLKTEVWKHLKDCQNVLLATEENGQPRARPVTLVNFNQKFWVLTGTNNAKVRQIQKNPKIEFCLLFQEGGHQGYIRAAGLAEIIKDRETKVKIAKHCSFFSEHWKSLDDPNYTLIELKLNEIEYLRPNEETATKLKP